MHSGIFHRFNKWLYLLVLIAGALTVFAFSPFDYYPLAWITPIFLFYALSKADTKKQHFYLGFLFGVGLFGAGVSWTFTSMYTFAHAPFLMALGGTALFVMMLAFFSTGFFGLFTWLFRKRPLFARLLLFYPAVWVLQEWFRGWFLTGFPWLYLGSSQIDSIFAAYAPIAGVLGVSWVVVMISGALLSFFLGGSVKRTVTVSKNPEDRLVSRQAVVEERFSSSIRVLAATVIVLLTSLAFALEKINWTQQSGEPLNVSVLQSNITQNEKLDRSKLDWAINRYREMTLKSLTSHLIVWPETGLFDDFTNHMDSLIIPLQKQLKNKQAILLGGFFVNDNKGVENSVLALSADSREIYSKRHLVPFGEYIPLLKYIRWMGDWIPYSNIDAGVNDGTLTVSGEIAQMTICYEDAFGSEIISSLPKASLLINVTHDGWFSGSLQPQQHMQIARMRSLETGRYMVRATTTGPAGIINEKGRVIATAPIDTQKIITGRVQPYSGATPYVRWGNWLIIGILSGILLLGLLWKREK